MGGRLRVVCIPCMIVLESRWSFSALTGLIHPHRDQVRKLRRMHIVTVVSISSFFFFFFFSSIHVSNSSRQCVVLGLLGGKTRRESTY